MPDSLGRLVELRALMVAHGPAGVAAALELKKHESHSAWSSADEAAHPRGVHGKFAKVPGGSATVELSGGASTSGVKFDAAGNGYVSLGGGLHTHFHPNGRSTTHQHAGAEDGPGLAAAKLAHSHPDGPGSMQDGPGALTPPPASISVDVGGGRKIAVAAGSVAYEQPKGATLVVTPAGKILAFDPYGKNVMPPKTATPEKLAAGHGLWQPAPDKVGAVPAAPAAAPVFAPGTYETSSGATLTVGQDGSGVLDGHDGGNPSQLDAATVANLSPQLWLPATPAAAAPAKFAPGVYTPKDGSAGSLTVDATGHADLLTQSGIHVPIGPEALAAMDPGAFTAPAGDPWQAGNDGSAWGNDPFELIPAAQTHPKPGATYVSEYGATLQVHPDGSGTWNSGLGSPSEEHNAESVAGTLGGDTAGALSPYWSEQQTSPLADALAAAAGQPKVYPQGTKLSESDGTMWTVGADGSASPDPGQGMEAPDGSGLGSLPASSVAKHIDSGAFTVQPAAVPATSVVEMPDGSVVRTANLPLSQVEPGDKVLVDTAYGADDHPVLVTVQDDGDSFEGVDPSSQETVSGSLSEVQMVTGQDGFAVVDPGPAAPSPKVASAIWDGPVGSSAVLYHDGTGLITNSQGVAQPKSRAEMADWQALYGDGSGTWKPAGGAAAPAPVGEPGQVWTSPQTGATMTFASDGTAMWSSGNLGEGEEQFQPGEAIPFVQGWQLTSTSADPTPPNYADEGPSLADPKNPKPGDVFVVPEDDGSTHSTMTINPDGSAEITNVADGSGFHSEYPGMYLEGGAWTPLGGAPAAPAASAAPSVAGPGDVYYSGDGTGMLVVQPDGSGLITYEDGAVKPVAAPDLALYANSPVWKKEPAASKPPKVYVDAAGNPVTPVAPAVPQPPAPPAGADPALVKAAAVMDFPADYPYPVVVGAPPAAPIGKTKQIKAVSLRPGDVVLNAAGTPVAISGNKKIKGSGQHLLTFQAADGSTEQFTVEPDMLVPTVARTPHPTITAAGKKAKLQLAALGPATPAAAPAVPAAPTVWHNETGSATVTLLPDGTGLVAYGDESPTSVSKDTMDSFVAGKPGWTAVGAQPAAGDPAKITLQPAAGSAEATTAGATWTDKYGGKVVLQPDGTGVHFYSDNGGTQTLDAAMMVDFANGAFTAWTLNATPVPAAPAAPHLASVGGGAQTAVNPGDKMFTTPAGYTAKVTPDGTVVCWGPTGNKFAGPAPTAAVLGENGNGAWTRQKHLEPPPAGGVIAGPQLTATQVKLAKVKPWSSVYLKPGATVLVPGGGSMKLQASPTYLGGQHVVVGVPSSDVPKAKLNADGTVTLGSLEHDNLAVVPSSAMGLQGPVAGPIASPLPPSAYAEPVVPAPAAAGSLVSVQGGTAVPFTAGMKVGSEQVSVAGGPLKWLHTTTLPAPQVQPGSVISWMGEPSAPYLITKVDVKPGGKPSEVGFYGKVNGTGPEKYLFLQVADGKERQVQVQVTPPPGWKPPPPPEPMKPGSKLNVKTKQGFINGHDTAQVQKVNATNNSSSNLQAAWALATPTQHQALAAVGLDTPAAFANHFDGFGWNGSSNDSNKSLLAFHHAVASEFGLDADSVASWQKEQEDMHLKGQVQQHLATHGSAYQAAARIMWQQTQNRLAAQGITEVHIIRGHSFYGESKPSWAKSSGVKSNVALRPLSSFSTSKSVADGFGPYQVSAVVPRELIFGSYGLNQFGTGGELEYAVLGAKVEWTVASPDDGGGHKAAGDLEVKADADDGTVDLDWCTDATEDWAKTSWPFLDADGDEVDSYAQMRELFWHTDPLHLLFLPIGVHMPALLRAELEQMMADPDLADLREAAFGPAGPPDGGGSGPGGAGVPTGPKQGGSGPGEAKAVRHVRTPAGAELYDEPIGAPIVAHPRGGSLRVAGGSAPAEPKPAGLSERDVALSDEDVQARAEAADLFRAIWSAPPDAGVTKADIAAWHGEFTDEYAQEPAPPGADEAGVDYAKLDAAFLNGWYGEFEGALWRAKTEDDQKRAQADIAAAGRRGVDTSAEAVLAQRARRKAAASNVVEQELYEEYDRYVEVMYVKAIKATNAAIYSKAGKAAADAGLINDYDLFRGKASVNKYASEELLEFFETNPRYSFREYRAYARGRESDLAWLRTTGARSGSYSRDSMVKADAPLEVAVVLIPTDGWVGLGG